MVPSPYLLVDGDGFPESHSLRSTHSGNSWRGVTGSARSSVPWQTRAKGFLLFSPFLRRSRCYILPPLVDLQKAREQDLHNSDSIQQRDGLLTGPSVHYSQPSCSLFPGRI